MKQRTLLQKILIAAATLFLLNAVIHRVIDFQRRRRGALAIVHISGLIRSNLSSSGWSGPDAEDLARRLHRLSEDKDIKAIVLRINSPGGTVGAVQEISREIERCRAKGKIVVASLADVAASGGYYLAAGSNRIVTNPGTITGSIGVIIEFGNLSGLFQKVGVKLEVIKSGAMKDMGSPARALTAEERRILQSSINDAYAQFVEAVRQGRHLALDKIKRVADGRIFTGKEALKAGLVDELGNEEDAVQAAIRLAKLPAKPYILSDDEVSFSGWVDRVSSRISPWSVPSLQNAVSGAGLEYRWAL